MEVEQLINNLKSALKDVKKHRVDYCYIKIADAEYIIEYLKQFREIAYIP